MTRKFNDLIKWTVLLRILATPCLCLNNKLKKQILISQMSLDLFLIKIDIYCSDSNGFRLHLEKFNYNKILVDNQL